MLFSIGINQRAYGARSFSITKACVRPIVQSPGKKSLGGQSPHGHGDSLQVPVGLPFLLHIDCMKQLRTVYKLYQAAT